MPYKSVSELPSRVKVLPPGGQRMILSKKMLVDAYWEQGLSYRDIAARLGYRTPASVRYWFRKHNIPARTAKEAMDNYNHIIAKEKLKDPPKTLTKEGYVRRWKPDGYIYEHRYVWQQANGPIPKGHLIHHINGVKSDNRLENLACVSKQDHNTQTVRAIYQRRIRELESRISELEESRCHIKA